MHFMKAVDRRLRKPAFKSSRRIPTAIYNARERDTVQYVEVDGSLQRRQLIVSSLNHQLEQFPAIGLAILIKNFLQAADQFDGCGLQA